MARVAGAALQCQQRASPSWSTRARSHFGTGAGSLRRASMRSRNGIRSPGDTSITASPLRCNRRTKTQALGPLDHWDQGQDGIGVVLRIRERSSDERRHRDRVLMRECFRIGDERSGQSDANGSTINADVSGLPSALA